MPKTPLFTSGPGAGILAGTTFVYADLYTLTCPAGLVLRYAVSDKDWAYGGNTWFSDSVRIEDVNNPAFGHWKTGFDTDEWQVTIFPRNVADDGTTLPDKIGVDAWAEAAASGALDGAGLTVDIAMRDTWSGSSPETPYLVYRMFTGRVAAIDGIGRNGLVLTGSSVMSLLDTLMPRNLYGGVCRHTLFGPGCNNAGSLPAASFAVPGTVSSVASRSQFSSGIAAPGGSGTYNRGRVVFTTGPNTGFGRTTVQKVGSTFYLFASLPYTPQAGDTFLAYPGCQKDRPTCVLFGNQANFGGQRRIPVPERAISLGI